jgi:cyclopropane-fatty-acyl-phospholipid synthase
MERGLVPEFAMRAGIRRLSRERLRGLRRELVRSGKSLAEFNQLFLERAWSGPLALVPEKANEQHYEVPAAFYRKVLGPHRKYSCCYYENDQVDLAGAEQRALELTCEHAELVDGQEILELGCGWGSLTLWMAEHYPHARITALSNSHSQRQYIEQQAAARGLADRIRVITQDINRWQNNQPFDRVVSVEMFEHVRNHRQLLDQISGWLTPQGKLFVHIFCHRQFAYPFETQGSANWMGKYFFSGGMMPDQQLLVRAATQLQLEQQWIWDGRHYQRTSNHWVERLEQNRDEIESILEAVYGAGQQQRWFYRWKMFFLACAELFGLAEGQEWYVSHYRFAPR